ncbi:MAG TPA: Uma2 family endonuclease [Thiolinea sp.]|jgi:Uma2 family endonuclease|nr:Uma2 family endonuclease [Thiolinea sp.]
MLQPSVQLSREAYLLLEQEGELKHEYYAGQAFAMAGGTFRHARVAGNIYTGLATALFGKSCQPMNSDMRVHTPSGLDTYPDISVYCGEPELADNERTLLNPVMIIEVLSPSTCDYDRGGKFAHYRSILGLQDYLLVDPDTMLVEHYHRLGRDEWHLQVHTNPAEVLSLTALSVKLSIQAIYTGLS